MNALVLGAGGQLGAEMVRLLGPGSGFTHQELSITDMAAVERVIAERRPEVLFNCAAYNAVDRAESEPDVAFAINADGPRTIAVACERLGTKLVHFSTNYVFDGTSDRPYAEGDTPAPLSVYARSKLAGEEGVLGASLGALVLRTAAVYGTFNSFPGRVLSRARGGGPLHVVSDQRINPTYARDLAEAAVEQTERGATGLMHMVAEGCCTWDEYARAVLEEFGVEAEVQPVTSDAYPTPARRPRNGCLISNLIEPLRPWRDALHEWAGTFERP